MGKSREKNKGKVSGQINLVGSFIIARQAGKLVRSVPRNPINSVDAGTTVRIVRSLSIHRGHRVVLREIRGKKGWGTGARVETEEMANVGI